MWLMPGSPSASIEASLFSLGADDDGISIGGRAGRATEQAKTECEAIENEDETGRARCAGGVALVIIISGLDPGSLFVTSLVGLGRFAKVSVHRPTPAPLSYQQCTYQSTSSTVLLQPPPVRPAESGRIYFLVFFGTLGAMRSLT